jgi:hypothetical protein
LPVFAQPLQIRDWTVGRRPLPAHDRHPAIRRGISGSGRDETIANDCGYDRFEPSDAVSRRRQSRRREASDFDD